MCGIIAGVLHFLFLSAFAWMCLEGFQIYVMLIEVFEGERSRRKWYYLFGYGVPLVAVAVTAGIKPSGYGTERQYVEVIVLEYYSCKESVQMCS